jgi:hypothetical protein
MLKPVLIELHYLPPSVVFSWMKQRPVYFDLFEHYHKGSLRNRCQLHGANGLLQLSIPVQHGRHNHTAMKEVRISNATGWQRIHWMSICSAYRSAPWFEFFEEELHGFYHRPYQFLCDFNVDLMQWLMRQLQLPLDGIRFTDHYYDSREAETVFEDLRGCIHPLPRKSSASGFAAPQYQQVFAARNGFIPGLSMVDWLFAEGKAVSSQLGQQ